MKDLLIEQNRLLKELVVHKIKMTRKCQCPECTKLESAIAEIEKKIEEENDDDDKIILGDPDKLSFTTPMMGWICPRCQTVHGPFTSSCGCPPPTITRTSSGTTI